MREEEVEKCNEITCLGFLEVGDIIKQRWYVIHKYAFPFQFLL